MIDSDAVPMTRTATAALAALLLAVSLASPADAAPRKGTFGKHASWHGIRIGMTVKQAKATTKLKPIKFYGACAYTGFKKYPTPLGVMISRKVGVAIVGADAHARTPRGIGVGSTRKQIKTAYPTVRHYEDADTVRVPGYRHVLYGFQMSGGKAQYMWVMSDRQDCAN